MGLDFVSGQYGCIFSRCRKYVINSLIHGHFHIGLVIIPRHILALDCVSGQYGGLGMITRFLNIIIQSNLFKRSNFQVISQFIHIKDISKVNDNGNQYKQKLILWYWTKNYFLMGFTASKIYFYFGTISMF